MPMVCPLFRDRGLGGMWGMPSARKMPISSCLLSQKCLWVGDVCQYAYICPYARIEKAQYGGGVWGILPEVQIGKCQEKSWQQAISGKPKKLDNPYLFARCSQGVTRSILAVGHFFKSHLSATQAPPKRHLSAT